MLTWHHVVENHYIYLLTEKLFMKLPYFNYLNIELWKVVIDMNTINCSDCDFL